MNPITVGQRTYYVPDEDSPCDAWKQYFSQLKEAAGTSNARMLWLLTWQNAGDAGCTSRPEFIQWLQRHELDVSSASSRAVAEFSSLGSSVLGLSKGLTTTLTWVVPILLGGVTLAIVMTLISVGRKATLGDVLMATPAGRAMKVTQMMAG